MTKDFRLGDVLIEPASLRLSVAARSLTVQPRVMDLVTALAASACEVVSRQELETRIWGATSVGYHALARAVHLARRAFSELSPGLEVIETIPQRGYRLRLLPVPADTPFSPPVLPPVVRLARPGRAPAAVLSVLAFGLLMHAFGLHGTAFHQAGAATVLFSALWLPLPPQFLAGRSPSSG